MGPLFWFTSTMKIQLCGFSGYKMQPGRGKTIVRADGRVVQFLNSRCERAYLKKKNPREIRWTILYRRLHKKGVEEQEAKRRTRRTQKFQRAVVGASLTDIMAKRNMKPEVRKAQREQAIRAAKEKAKAAKTAAKAAAKPADPKAKKAAQAKAQKASQKVPKMAAKASRGVAGHGAKR